MFQMNRIILLAALLVLTTVLGRSFAADNPKPNVIVIIPDDQGFNDIGYHNSNIITPNLDDLAETGVKLETHYVCTTCSPTRAAIISGRPPSRYGILGPIGGVSTLALPPDTVTLADMLHSAGYLTAISGKWHLGLRPEVGPRQYGFESTYGYLHGQIDPYTHRYKFGDETWHRNDKFIKEEGHATDLITKEAVRVIKTSGDQPFFLYVTYSVPHYPLEEPDKWLDMYDGIIEDESRKLFAASLTHMDAGIGEIVAALNQSKKRANTLIIYSSDNGGQKSWDSPKNQYNGKFAPNPYLGNNAPLNGWKGDLHEGGIRVPAFANWPGTLKPRTVTAPVCILDWYPTIAGLIGIQPDDKLELEGEDIWPLLTRSQKQPPEREIYWKTSGESALRKGPWKIIERRRKANSTFRLFHLIDDPLERNNLAKTHPEKLKQLIASLKQQQSRDNATIYRTKAK